MFCNFLYKKKDIVMKTTVFIQENLNHPDPLVRQRALSEVYKTLPDYIKFFKHMFPNVSDYVIEDCVYNCFCLLYEKLCYTFDNTRGEFSAWFISIIKNKINESLRKHGHISCQDISHFADSVVDVQDGVSWREKKMQQIFDALAKATANGRFPHHSQKNYNIFIDYYVNRLSYAEISEKYNISIPVLLNLMTRIKKRIKKYLEHN